MAYSDNIRELREKLGYTQAELAEFAGVSQQAIDKIEKGRSKPDVFTAIDIAKKLGTSVEEMMCCDKSNTQKLTEYIEEYVGIVAKSCNVSKSDAAKAIKIAFMRNSIKLAEMIRAEIIDEKRGKKNE